MTNVLLCQNGSEYAVQAAGHATGNPQICTAVSTLLYTLAVWLRSFGIETETEKLEPGDALLIFRGDRRAETAFDLITCGFLQLQQTDPAVLHVDLKKI